jgi:hypothetical protein
MAKAMFRPDCIIADEDSMAFITSRNRGLTLKRIEVRCSQAGRDGGNSVVTGQANELGCPNELQGQSSRNPRGSLIYVSSAA